MAKVFTQEEREKIKGQVVELVRRSGRETLRQLEAKTGATRYLMSVLARELVASGDVYNSGYGLFPSEQARKDWQNARKKRKRTARAVLTGMCYSAGSAMRHGSSSLTRLTGQSAMTPSTWRR
ncbi:phage exclusion protein [Escherichia coli O157:H7]|nr:phage exclusion protein [Escherichia coli O157:H7]